MAGRCFLAIPFVILYENHKLPLVAVDLWYHVGPANEKAGRKGGQPEPRNRILPVQAVPLPPHSS